MYIVEEMRQLGGTFNLTNKIAHYPNGSLGYFRHCSDENDVLKLLSAQFGLMALDELSTFEWDMFTKLKASVRVTKASKVTAMVRAATNPLGPSAEMINHYFVMKDVDPEDDPKYNPALWHAVKGNLEDNPYVDADQYAQQFSGLSKHVLKAWVEGDFSLENALFDVRPTIKVQVIALEGADASALPTNQEIPYHVIRQIDLPAVIKASQIYRAYDHGYFPDPAVCLWIAHLGNRYIVIKEKYWYKTIITNIAADITKITKDLGIEHVVATYCDPTLEIQTGRDVRTNRDVFEDEGVPMDPSINDRALYASAVHLALGQEVLPYTPKLQMYAAGCPNLIKTLPMQRYDDSSMKRSLRMADHHDDHYTVALAYFLISHSSESRFEVPTFKLPRWMQKKKSDYHPLGWDNVRDTYRRR